ncbi:hypothetical protein GIB67_032505 [Kingdonia uniflora]|uniref:Uncharacterized protein n=1 Tax=Kingdonia uniflora TaxID=39325 RepID=A0A7J7L7K3_9MAGN|nr:hypothetical protein GIB67_032505 [Kingdonia uniflora]
MLRDELRKKRNGKAGQIKGALEKGKGKKRTCPMQNGNPGGSNQESVRATTSATKKCLNSKMTTSSHTHEQQVDENVEPAMSHVQPNVYNEVEVLTVLEWESKQGVMMQDELVGSVLPEAKNLLELYQSRGSRGFH